jgi:signal peptidase
MRLILRTLSICFYLIVLVLLAAAVGSAITKQPLLMSAVRSNSMYPVLERGDSVFVKRITPRHIIKVGDIVIFKTESGSYSSQGWIMHRVVEGNETDGYITKGDANELTDQESGGTVPIKSEWIASRAVTLGGIPIKIPLLGYIPLYMEKFHKNPYTLPVIAVILAIIVGFSELTGGKKKRGQKSRLDIQMIYFFSGLTIVIALGTSMLATGHHLTIHYQVSETNKGVITGSSVGILKVGEEFEQSLVKLENKGFFPIMATITGSDSQISFSNDEIFLKPGGQYEVMMNIHAQRPGKYESPISVGMFFPILPTWVICMLAKKSFWLALCIISLIPGIPVMIYPFIDTHLRRKALKQIRRWFRNIKRSVSL